MLSKFEFFLGTWHFLVILTFCWKFEFFFWHFNFFRNLNLFWKFEPFLKIWTFFGSLNFYLKFELFSKLETFWEIWILFEIWTFFRNLNFFPKFEPFSKVDLFWKFFCFNSAQDCRFSWKKVETHIGTCLELRPYDVINDERITKLSLVVRQNISDSTAGWSGSHNSINDAVFRGWGNF